MTRRGPTFDGEDRAVCALTLVCGDVEDQAGQALQRQLRLLEQGKVARIIQTEKWAAAKVRAKVDLPHCRGPTIATTGNVFIKRSSFSRSSSRSITSESKLSFIEISNRWFDILI
jgi:hypothetical protein